MYSHWKMHCNETNYCATFLQSTDAITWTSVKPLTQSPTTSLSQIGESWTQWVNWCISKSLDSDIQRVLVSGSEVQ